MAKILLLGGTEEARELAESLAARGADFTTALAGRTSAPQVPGPVTSGGFGGEEGLAETIRRDGVEVVVDATHPFAATISPAAKRAAKAAKVRYLRLERSRWRRAASDRWIEVKSLADAADALDSGSTVFLAVGAGGLAPFLPRRDLKLVVRTIEPPDLGRRDDITVINQRGPFDVDDERALWDRFRFDAMVTKNSGGEASAAKLVVARERRTLVYMVRRPRGQPWPDTRTAEKMMRRLRRHL